MVVIIKSAFSSSRMVKEFGKFLLAQINTLPNTRGKIGKKLEEAQDKLKEIMAKKEENFDDLLELERAFNWIQADFYNRIRDFHSHLVTVVEYDRKDALYVKYFPTGLRDFSRKSVAYQMEKVGVILQWIEDSGDNFGPVEEELKKVYQEMVGFSQQRKELEWARSRLRSEEKEIKEEWSLAYRETYFELMMVFGHKKAKVEPFFKRHQRSGPRKKDSSSEVEEISIGSEISFVE